MKRILLASAIILSVISCSRNPVTGRKQLSLVSEDQLQQMALTEYKTFLSQNKVVSNVGNKDAEMVRRVGSRIAKAITDYYNTQGKGDILKGYNWEFNLVDSKEVNAWCMPGGKVVVYTGLLPVTQNEAALAIVLGHEITHAVAKHGNERMSQEMVAQGIGVAGNVLTGNNPQVNSIFNNIYAPGSQVAVLLPNSRNQEYEADHFGLLFAAMAGYNPREAIPFWQRMQAMSGGSQQPEFLSTHPADANRIQRLQGYMDEALKYYKPVNSKN
ncbi:M48 family metallopeptidase [Ferruginibacter albus]|uniref:M48 family metallopeptidase n=1 Tax=Ferruginibacter albus TaxID=2875540 RepID=UPI001CC79EB6|nr:M48 family metallopeptidase [Ferruginibacter albus]UAY53401.1 M48 family metallopeptidase [Ferruginibacter albus]